MAQWMWKGEHGNVTGKCKGCGAIVPAMGLTWTPDHVLFGKEIEGGWHCATCKPRQFGKINGMRAEGWEYDTGKRPKTMKVMAELNKVMTSKTIKTRNRKPKPMGSL